MLRTVPHVIISGSLGTWVFGYFLLALAFLSLLANPAPAQTSEAALRRQLESNYGDWHNSMLRKDHAAYTRATAPARIAYTRNQIVSQRLPYPASLFSLPFNPPSLVQLRFLSARANATGDTAIGIYYGRIDFGVPHPTGVIPENIFLIHFIKDGSDWKFDRTRVLNLEGPDGTSGPGMRTRIARGELDFLSEPDFQPESRAPSVPALVKTPDHVAHLAIVSIGYETRVHINGETHQTLVVHNAVRDLVIGGLAEGKNAITIETKALEDLPPPPDDAVLPETPFSVEVYVMRDRERLPPARIFHFAPKTPPATHSAPLWANAVTIK